MNARILPLLLFAALPIAAVAQAPPATPPDSASASARPCMYGDSLMTDTERAEYRAKMQSLKTQEERAAFRLEHQKKMQERASQRGVTLPPCPGMGQGMGQGRQMGPGMGGPPGTRTGQEPAPPPPPK